MLLNAEIIKTTAENLSGQNLSLIIDPVMVSTSGVRLLEENAIAVLKNELLPLATWITPNIAEAELLSGRKITTNDEAVKAAVEFGHRWDCSIIIKAGHLNEKSEIAADIIYHEEKNL